MAAAFVLYVVLHEHLLDKVLEVGVGVVAVFFMQERVDDWVTTTKAFSPLANDWHHVDKASSRLASPRLLRLAMRCRNVVLHHQDKALEAIHRLARHVLDHSAHCIDVIG